ncbi:MAG: flavin reductase family protein [Anaerolineae bacterium]|nr:flavin reductase family protein [Anaerolineae bacterium]
MKVKLGTIPLVYPIPIVLAGANVQGKANFATLGDCGIMGLNPPLVYVSLHENHYTTQGIEENQTYSINIPSTSMLAVTDYCGQVTGTEVDKSSLFEVFYGKVETAPMIGECRVNLECRVVKAFAIEHRRIYVGEVVQAYVDEACVVEKEGRREIVPMTELAPILYGLDNRYYSVGEMIGVGYVEGKMYQREGGD